jgi:hypothetical protein
MFQFQSQLIIKQPELRLKIWSLVVYAEGCVYIGMEPIQFVLSTEACVCCSLYPLSLRWIPLLGSSQRQAIFQKQLKHFCECLMRRRLNFYALFEKRRGPIECDPARWHQVPAMVFTLPLCFLFPAKTTHLYSTEGRE